MRSRRQDVTLRCQRRADIEDRWQRSYSTLRFGHGAARGRIRHGGDCEQRLPGVLHQTVGEDRIVMNGAAIVVLARNIRRHGDSDNARRAAHVG